jgi:branched-chain amino acid transport system substrate-binding protein
MNKKIIIGIVIIILIVLGVWVSNKNQNNLSAINEIKIGSILIESGDGASWGEAARNGMDLAIKEINDQGGILGKKVVAIHEDDAGDPAKTVGAFRKLTQTDGVKFIVGPSWSKNGDPIKDLITNEIVISPSLGNANFNETSKFIFNTWPHDYILSAKLADYVLAKGVKNVAILGANEVWCKAQTMAFKERFEKLGGVVSFVYEPTTDQRDVRTDLLKLKQIKDLQAIVVTSDGYGLTSVYGKQMRDLGIKMPTYSITLDNTVIKNCEGTCNGWEFLTALTPKADFSAKYKSIYNREVEIGSDSAYDAVMLIAKGIKETKSLDTNVVQKYLNNIKTYDGQSGILNSDGKGAFTKDFKTMIIKSGIPVELK